MLPTKGYFQDIECPFYNSSCGRPYCHFRHKRKLNETVEENDQETAKDAVPTYKPTPKSELANIHNNKSHIPISYVPDLQFKRERTARPLPRIEKPTYKPTPLSILSSVNKPDSSSVENDEHRDTIKDIQQNIANKVYDPLQSKINFGELSEFDLIDNTINNGELESHEKVNTNLIKIESDIEEQQNKLNLLKSEINNSTVNNDSEKQIAIKSEEDKVNKEKLTETCNSKEVIESKIKERDKRDPENKLERDKFKSDRTKSSNKDKFKEKDEQSKSSKSKEREKHRKEQKKNSSKESKSKDKSKERDDKRDKKKSSKINSGCSSSESSCSESGMDREKFRHEKQSKHSSSKSKVREKHKRSRDKRSKSRSLSSSREHKSKNKSSTSSRSRSKHTSRKQSRSREKDKHSRRKDKDSSDKKKESKSYHEKKDKEKSKKSTSESSSSNQNDNGLDILECEENIPSDIDLDLDDEDETMRECFKIFTEYKPEPIQTQEPERIELRPLFEEDTQYSGKKRTAHAGAESTTTQSKLTSVPKPKALATPGQTLASRYKMAKLTQQSNEQENIMNEVKNIVNQPPKRPATSLLEAARQLKLRKMEQLKKQQSSSNVVDDILNGVHQPSVSQVKIQPKRIAAVPNVAMIEKAKQRISLIKQQRTQLTKTVAQTQKAGRVAHVPEFSLSDIPDVLQADKSKLPVNVRSRFLTMIADECGKLYAMKEDAYTRALNEEFACYEKCKVLTTYRNSAMLAVNRLRKELQERETKGLGLILSGESSISDKEGDFKGKTFYDHVKKWLLTEEELDLHGYPKESTQKGKAIINNRKEKDFSLVDENYRKCSRCSKTYQVDDDGWSLFEEECLYHPLRKRTIKGEQIYLCCKSNDDTGCVTSDTHVFDGLEKHLLEGFQTTLPPEKEDDPRSTTVYALDCEMCYTTKGLELTRVTIIDTECKTVYESLVKPLNPIIDYNTRFSGITKDQMDRTSTSILQIQANILHLCNSETILVGHSLESDLKALKIIHGSIIDTSVLFPHKMGLPHKRALRALASEHLKKIIQNDVSGHDSAEDAIACMDLIKWKLKENLKLRTK